MTRRNPAQRGVIAVAAAAGTLVALTAAVAPIGNEGPQVLPATHAGQVSAVGAACARWADEAAPRTGRPSWCDDMTRWMDERMVAGRSGSDFLMGSPHRMRESCRAWVGEDAPAGVSADDTEAWCQALVAWMEENLPRWSGRGSWDDWMMRGDVPVPNGAGGPS